MKPVRWQRETPAHDVVGVLLARGNYKSIAFRFGVSIAQVSRIKRGLAHPNITARFRVGLNATLTTLAIYPEAA